MLLRRQLPLFLRQTSPVSRFLPTFVRYASSKALPTPPSLTEIPDPETSPEEVGRVRSWLERFQGIDTGELREARGVFLTFSRSSGPGGQNVNKVNTKATLRCQLDAPWIPMWAKRSLTRDPHYASSSHSLLVTSTVFRSQAQNINDCLSKLHSIVISCATAGLRNATSEDTKERVEKLLKIEKARKRLEKEKRSSVKKARSTSKYWD